MNAVIILEFDGSQMPAAPMEKAQLALDKLLHMCAYELCRTVSLEPCKFKCLQMGACLERMSCHLWSLVRLPCDVLRGRGQFEDARANGPQRQLDAIRVATARRCALV